MSSAIVKVLNPSGGVDDTKDVEVDSHGRFTVSFVITHPELWYPHTYGEQPLYSLSVKIPGHEVFKTVGLRKLHLLQEPVDGENGTSFTFEINNIAIFCGGSNWIPGDMFLPRMNSSEYQKWLCMAKEGNQIMVRAWGGGIYEDDEFYNYCDRLGIIVWQDFMIACGNYPAERSFVEQVRDEARQALLRIHHHPSLVLLAGNNEDYSFAVLDNWGWDEDDDNIDNWQNTKFPAREIYERLLPSVCKELCPNVPYW